MNKSIVFFLLGCVYATASNAIGVFADDFESGLSAWTGTSGGAHNGVIVQDPIRTNNKVLTFSNLSAGGDIFTVKQFILDTHYSYIISFEYLGKPTTGSVKGDLGGFAGLSEDMPGRHMWYYGTSTGGGAKDWLIDDGKWHLYTYHFRPAVTFYTTGDGFGSNVHLMLEDFSGSLGVAGDVYFDNIRIEKEQIPAINGIIAPSAVQQ